jgi:hypothetical protein
MDLEMKIPVNNAIATITTHPFPRLGWRAKVTARAMAFIPSTGRAKKCHAGIHRV